MRSVSADRAETNDPRKARQRHPKERTEERVCQRLRSRMTQQPTLQRRQAEAKQKVASCLHAHGKARDLRPARPSKHEAQRSRCRKRECPDQQSAKLLGQTAHSTRTKAIGQQGESKPVWPKQVFKLHVAESSRPHA